MARRNVAPRQEERSESETRYDPRRVAQANEAAVARLNQAEEQLGQVSNSVAVLRTETDRARSLFGFGRRILVPPDEIHVVVGDGRHIWAMANERRVFGQTADRPSRYWLNALTQVIKLKTVSFTVSLHGTAERGVAALDSSKVSFRLWAHAVAKLNPDKAEIAAQRVGLDTAGLVNTITEVGTAELIAAAATMSLEAIIADRQRLAEIAFPKVNQILSELGYDLALLTVTRLDGEAYHRLVTQAEARVSKETSVATNREQLAELQDDQAREQLEAEIRAETEKKLAAERLEAQQEVETATINQQEALEVRRHEKQLLHVSRQKAAAEKQHETDLATVQLAQRLDEAEAEKEARIARLRAEREAELRALQQKRAAQINLAETGAEAERLAVAQAREIERMAALTEAEAQRLRQEELAAAERAKEIAVVGAASEAEALAISTEAQTRAELVRAEAEATATEKRAVAAKKRAEATRAETAAPGLAEAEVEEARVRVADKQVAVNRAEGLAQAEVAQAQAEAEAERARRLKEVEVNAQKQLATLYEQAPVLVDLERLRLELAHEERLASIRADASLKALQALAPGVKIHLIGNGGQTGELLSSVMALGYGLNHLGEEVPLVGQVLQQRANGSKGKGGVLRQLTRFAPQLRQLLGDMNPRVLAGLTVADVVEQLHPVISGDETLVAALKNLQEDASFRVIGDLPVRPLLGILGMAGGEGGEGDSEMVLEESLSLAAGRPG